MTEYTYRELDTAHKKSFQNEPLVKRAKDCGCYCCLEHFSPAEITYWVEDKLYRTAMCPKCDIDSVLTEEVLDRVPDDLLVAMQKTYFGVLTSVSLENPAEDFEAIFEAYNKEKEIRLFEADLILADKTDNLKK